MFYAHIVLAKKGPLARIWLAAHWDKKLTKAHVFETNIEQSVDGIMQPKVKLALRTSGHLLLGVVRIYSRKAKYLLADCNEAFVKIKMAFRPGMVDLPEEHREAAVNAITLPEVFHDFDSALPELNDVDIEAQFSINQSRADEITMREDYGSLPMSIHDDGFGDIGFDAEGPDFIRDDVDENLMTEELEQSEMEDRTLKEPSGFGHEPAAGLFEGDLFGEAPLEQSTLPPLEQESDNEMDGGWDAGGHSPASSIAESRPPTPLSQPLDDGAPLDLPGTSPAPQINETSAALEPSIDTALPGEAGDGADVAREDQERDGDAVEEESFALAPIDASALKGVTKTKRKRKLIVDEVKNISGEEMKSQLANTSDIVTTLDLAPPTKRLMYWKETGGVEKLFALPSRDIPARSLAKNYQRNLVSRSMAVEDFSVLGPPEALAIDQYQEQPPTTTPAQEAAVSGKRGRKRKHAQIDADITSGDAGLIRHEDDTARSMELTAQDGIFKQRDSLMPPPATPGGGDDVSAPPLEGELPMPFTPSAGLGAELGGMTPVGLHGDYQPFTPLDQIESIPNLPVDQVSSILNGTGMDGYGYEAGPSAGMSERIATDWTDDYDFPPSVGPPTGDEQMENETDEQFEERVLNKRAAQMFLTVKTRLQKNDNIQLSEMTYRNSRKQAAQKFYSLLVLKKFQALELRQDESYGDITVMKGIMFDNPKL